MEQNLEKDVQENQKESNVYPHLSWPSLQNYSTNFIPCSVCVYAFSKELLSVNKNIYSQVVWFCICIHVRQYFFFFLLAVKVSMITIEIFSFDSTRHFKLETEGCKSLVLFSTDVTSSSIRMLLKGKGMLWQLKGCQKWPCAGRREDDFILLTWINILKTDL